MNIKDTVHLLLMHEEGGSSITNLEALDLTKRQAKVLTLLAQGALIRRLRVVDISERTVHQTWNISSRSSPSPRAQLRST